MRREEFTDLLQRYVDNTCTDSEKKLVEHWYSLLEEDAGRIPEPVDFAAVEARLWQRIKPPPVSGAPALQKPQPVLGRTRMYRWVGIAASLLLLSTIGWLSYPAWRQVSGQPQAVSNQGPTNWIEKENTNVAPMTVSLRDGSQVTLEPGSRLRYPGAFLGDKREVYLVGKAFFQVAKVPARPFYVYAGRVVTKVLGTSFHVRMQEEKQQVQVEVVTGRVSVYEKKTAAGLVGDTKGVIVNPNHKAIYHTDNQLFTTGLVDAPVLVDTTYNQAASVGFVYDDAPLARVIEDLEAAYGIDITLENEQVSTCPITADVRKKSLYTQLDIICAALQASYSVRGTTILISGKGCQ